METLYRKVSTEERNPTKSGEYFTNEGTVFYASTYNGFEHNIDPHRVYPDWWLEEIPNHTAQLKADKAELLEVLEFIFPMFTELDSEFGIENPPPRKWTETETATVQKLFDLIQKHKQ